MSRLTNTPSDEADPSQDESEKPNASAGESGEILVPPVATRRRRHRKPPGIAKEWYSKTEAAQYLGVAEITITRYLEKGILHAHRLPTPGRETKHGEQSEHSPYDYGRLRIHKSELDRYLERVDRHPDDAQASEAGWRSNERSAGGNSVTTARLSYEPQEEQELARLAQTGDTRALERLRRDNLIMTREEAALRLGVSWRTIKRYIESSGLRLAGYFRCPDSYTRAHVFRSDVERLLGRDEATGSVATTLTSSNRDVLMGKRFVG